MRAAELMVHHAAQVYDSGGNPGAEANMAKLLASEASWAAADMCVQTFGGFGFAEEYDVERKFREARLYTVAPISTNLILSYLAEHVLAAAQLLTNTEEDEQWLSRRALPRCWGSSIRSCRAG
jgi:alkylation response protein AidB-like acyl-CoA dehydrogenase